MRTWTAITNALSWNMVSEQWTDIIKRISRNKIDQSHMVNSSINQSIMKSSMWGPHQSPFIFAWSNSTNSINWNYGIKFRLTFKTFWNLWKLFIRGKMTTKFYLNGIFDDLKFYGWMRKFGVRITKTLKKIIWIKGIRKIMWRKRIWKLLFFKRIKDDKMGKWHLGPRWPCRECFPVSCLHMNVMQLPFGFIFITLTSNIRARVIMEHYTWPWIHLSHLLYINGNLAKSLSHISIRQNTQFTTYIPYFFNRHHRHEPSIGLICGLY